MSQDVNDDGSNLRFWRKDGTVVNVPFDVAAAAPELRDAVVALLDAGGEMIPDALLDDVRALLARIDGKGRTS